MPRCYGWEIAEDGSGDGGSFSDANTAERAKKLSARVGSAALGAFRVGKGFETPQIAIMVL